MGRLSAYAKNRILKLRFKKNKRIIHIVEILKRDDNIKVSRQAVSTFLKKYLETNSIYDKPRTGRKRKLTPEEIQLIGQVTRLNRDITARAIKEYLNLNVSTYTILRATKLFEWNKVNLNSNEAKRQMAAEKKVTEKKPSATPAVKKNKVKKEMKANENSIEGKSDGDDDDEEKKQNDNNSDYMSTSQLSSNNEMGTVGDDVDQDYDSDESGEVEKIQPKHNLNGAGTLESPPKEVPKKPRITAHSIPDFEKVDLQLLGEKELVALKNLSCSPMSFATKILFKIFKEEELHGHNVSGKTLNRNIKAKLPLDPLRVGYIKFLVEAWYDESEYKEMLTGANNKQDLWKSCHTAINKSILISERKATMGKQHDGKKVTNGSDATTSHELNGDEIPLAVIENGTNGCSTDHIASPKPDSKKIDDVYEFQNGADDESDETFEINKKKRKVTKTKKTTTNKKTAANPKRQRRHKSPDHDSSSSEEEAFDSIGEYDSDYDDNSSCSSDDGGPEGTLPLHMDEELEARIRQYKAKQQSLGATTTNFRRNLDSGTPTKKSTTNGNSTKQNTVARKTRPTVNDSSEALAAANIAASMKKRLVVVSDINDSIGNGSSVTTPSEQPSAKPAKSSPKRSTKKVSSSDADNQLNSSGTSPVKLTNGKDTELKDEPQEEPEPTNTRSARSSPKTPANTKLLNTSQSSKIQTRSSNRISNKK